MRPSGDIISLASRRALHALPPVDDAIAAVTHARRSATARRVGLTLALAAATLIAGLAAGTWRNAGNLGRVPPSIRLSEYTRALTDAELTCAGPEASAGPLRRHCVEQAQFLVLFPECDARCRAVVDAILPHARR